MAYAGTTYLSGVEPGTVRARVARITPHPLYNPDTADFDVAVLQLDGPLAFGRRVQPVCLPAATHVFPPRRKCLISGWGYLREDFRKCRAPAAGPAPRSQGSVLRAPCSVRCAHSPRCVLAAPLGVTGCTRSVLAAEAHGASCPLLFQLRPESSALCIFVLPRAISERAPGGEVGACQRLERKGAGARLCRNVRASAAFSACGRVVARLQVGDPTVCVNEGAFRQKPRNTRFRIGS